MRYKLKFLREVHYKAARANRQKKWKIFNNQFNITPDIKLLNVGFTEHEYRDVDNYIEKNYLYPEMITSLGIDKPQRYKERYPGIRVIQYDGKIFPFKDKEFDICWSNAVLEHVGYYERQLLFIKEIKRVSKAAFISTPNRYFPFEIHTKFIFLHFLPKKVFDKILVFMGHECATGEKLNLLSHRDIKKILKDAGIKNYKLFKNRFFGFVLEFIIIFND